ncbi:MAG: hypothetical protein CL472_03400 [Acidobacteria bacterium]|nr:hypothetical protein [Acidobacteriota bacterium]
MLQQTGVLRPLTAWSSRRLHMRNRSQATLPSLDYSIGAPRPKYHVETQPAHTMSKIGLPLTPRQNASRKSLPRRNRRTMRFLLMFVTCISLADAVIGERGLFERNRAGQRHADLEATILEIRQENARLQEQTRRLLKDPRAIEAIARRELGLIRKGEVLFIIKDAEPASRRAE